MDTSTSRSEPQELAVTEPAVTAVAWAAGNGSLQVPLAGLLAHDPSLHTAELAPEEWQRLLAEYKASPRV